ncbi:FkbM family methyltransferase [Aridibaculum aurantiacum]|uniref:FkbM family methyltransferase n=1 Tax=Aridibaculum aurantiacum TaxID=2810307 RepID=UPI001A9622E6|nr:FkbM family methyltransferase [Aridibaculum aurantiacum]
MKKKILPTKNDRKHAAIAKRQIDFYKNLVMPNDLCFDIGANIGSKTKVFLQLQARVVAVEPQRNCTEILAALYGNKATVLQKGAGAKNEVKEFFVANHSELSSFNEDWISELKKTRFASANVQSVEKVEIVTLDSLIQTYGRPAFIKIDVEGYELEVLKGLHEPFGCLSFEYTVPEKKATLVEALEYLRQHYPNSTCNYVIGREDHFALKTWVSIDDLLQLVQKQEFDETSAGDVYVRSSKN